MFKLRCVIFTVLILILANEVGLQRINPWWGLFAIAVFGRELINDLWYEYCEKPRKEKVNAECGVRNAK